MPDPIGALLVERKIVRLILRPLPWSMMKARGKQRCEGTVSHGIREG